MNVSSIRSYRFGPFYAMRIPLPSRAGFRFLMGLKAEEGSVELYLRLKRRRYSAGVEWI